MPVRPLLALVLGIAACSRGLEAQVFPRLEEFHVRAFAGADGLLAADVRRIVQTDDGYLYVASGRGLQRFDGYGFTRVLLPGFQSEFVEWLHRDREDRVWIVSAAGDLGILQQGTVRALPRPPVAVARFSSFQDGSVWFGSYDGLVRVVAGATPAVAHFTGLDGLPSDSVQGAFEIGDDRFVVTERQFARIVADSSRAAGVRFVPFGTRYHSALDVRADSASVWVTVMADAQTLAVLRYRDGRVETLATVPLRDASTSYAFDWTRSQIDALTPRTGWHTHKGYVTNAGLPGDRLLHGAMAGADGTHWLVLTPRRTGPDLLVRRSGGRLDTIALSPHLDFVRIRHLIEDSEGSVWVGTDRGLLQLWRRRVAAVSRVHGLAESFTTAVRQTRDGAVWAGTWGGGLHRFADGRLSRLAEAQGLPRDEVRALYESRDGTLWVGVLGGWAAVRNSRVVESGRADAEVRAFAETRDGVLWAGTGTQLLARRPHGFVAHRPDFWADKQVWALHGAGDGALWIGTERGLFRLEGDSLREFGERDGMRGRFVVSIHEGPDGTLWFGTYEHGLHRYRDGRLAAVTTNEGLYHDGVWSMVPDDRGGVWMSSDQGVFRVEYARLHEVADAVASGRRPAARLAPLIFTESEGMPHRESNRASPAGWRLRDGRIVFNNLNGLAVIDPTRAVASPGAPRVILQGIHADGAPVPTRLSARAPLGTKQVTFSFAAMSFLAPGQNRYRYRLDGYDDAWVDGGREPRATYTNLPPARYVFRVQAASGAGAWSEGGAGHVIVVPPFMWQTWWFRLVVVAAVLALATAAYRYRVARLLEVERLRMRIAADLHDDVGSNLSSIALLSQMLQGRTNLDDGAQRQLQRIHAAADETVTALRDVIWLVDPAHRDLGDLVGRMRSVAAHQPDDVACEFVVSAPPAGAPLTMTFMRGVLLVYKEALHNATRHARATNVAVEIRAGNGEFTLSVRDDGVGFAPDAVHSGRGLANMRRRAAQIGARLDIASEPGAGTRLTFSAPMA